MNATHQYMLGTLAALLIGASLASCDKTERPAETDIRFLSAIKPLLTQKCLPCHNTGTLLGELNLENRALAFAEGSKGRFIVPGKPDESRLYHVLVKPRADDDAMPPEGHAITPDDIATIRDWIAQGAEWPDGPEGVLVPLNPGEA